MKELYVVVVEMNEVGRTVNLREASKMFMTHMHLLFDTGAGVSAIGGCWIENCLVEADDCDTKLTLNRRTLYVYSFFDVIQVAHENGWMKDGKWVDEASAV